MRNGSLLIVDDEADIREMLAYRLAKAGYETCTAENGQEALGCLEKARPDLVVLDVMMSGIDGHEVCRRIRANPAFSRLPVLMLTAKNTESDEIVGLESGADDYVTKPVSIRLLLTRIQTLLRRSDRKESSDAIVIGNITLDREQYLVTKKTFSGEQRVDLPRKEFELLALFMAHPGIVYTRAELLNEVWGANSTVIDRTVDVHIRKIREKLGQDVLQTVKGVGYRFRI